MEDAAALEEAGLREDADRRLERGAPPVALAAVEDRPTIEGLRERVTWTYEIVNVDQIADGFVKRVPDRGKIRRAVNSLGAEAQRIVGPGIKVRRIRSRF